MMAVSSRALAPTRQPVSTRFAGGHRKADPAANSLKANTTPIDQATFTVIDTETSGLEPKDSMLLSVSAIKYRNREPVAQFMTFIRPTDKTVDLEKTDAFKYNGITNDKAQKAPVNLKTALSQLQDFVGPAPLLVGQNVNFDLSQINARLDEIATPLSSNPLSISRIKSRTMSLLGKSPAKNPFSLDNALDTRTISKQALLDIEGNDKVGGSLKDVTRYLGITNSNPHDAQSDAMATAEVLYAWVDKLNAVCPKEPVKTVGDLRQYQGPVQTEYRWNPDKVKKNCLQDDKTGETA